MRKIIILSTFLFILTLTACSSQSKIDINGYISKINSFENENFTLNDFLLTSNGEEYNYKTVKNNVLMSVYCNKNGEITQITLTSAKRSDCFDKLCISSISAFTESADAEADYKKAIAVGRTDFEEYKIVFIDYDIGNTVIINYRDAEINTNENPTLKKYINENDISRPALSE